MIYTPGGQVGWSETNFGSKMFCCCWQYLDATICCIYHIGRGLKNKLGKARKTGFKALRRRSLGTINSCPNTLLENTVLTNTPLKKKTLKNTRCKIHFRATHFLKVQLYKIHFGVKNLFSSAQEWKWARKKFRGFGLKRGLARKRGYELFSGAVSLWKQLS